MRVFLLSVNNIRSTIIFVRNTCTVEMLLSYFVRFADLRARNTKYEWYTQRDSSADSSTSVYFVKYFERKMKLFVSCDTSLGRYFCAETSFSVSIPTTNPIKISSTYFATPCMDNILVSPTRWNPAYATFSVSLQLVVFVSFYLARFPFPPSNFSPLFVFLF